MLATLRSLFLCLTLIPLLSCNAEEAPEKYQAGKDKDYEILVAPVRTNNPDKIEVVEAFWYGCPHCYHLEPYLARWLKSVPGDVYFVGLPVSWGDPVKALHAKIYFTAEQLGKLDALHSATFSAMNTNPKSFNSEEGIAALFAENGVNAETFSKTFRSFSVDSLAKQADAKVRSYNIASTPTLIINGKYKIQGNPEKMLAVANFLIEKERAAMKASKK